MGAIKGERRGSERGQEWAVLWHHTRNDKEVNEWLYSPSWQEET